MRLSTRHKYMLYTLIILGAFTAIVLIGRRQAAQIPAASDDPISLGITQRWGAALPEGFSKQSVERINGEGGYIFGRLTYDKDIGKALAWYEDAADGQAAMDAIIDAQLSWADTTPEEAELISKNRPILSKGWIWYTLVNENNPYDIIVLCYDPVSFTMYVAEQQHFGV